MTISMIRSLATTALVGLGAMTAVWAPEAQAIVGGTSTTAFRQVSGADSGFGASAVQIAPNWVLTARHVGLGVGGTFSDGYGSASVAARYVAGTGVQLSDDLALLRLSTSIAAPQLTLWGALLAPAPTGYLYSGLTATMVTGKNQSPRGYAFSQVVDFWANVDVTDNGQDDPVAVNYLQVANPTGFGAPYVQGGDSGGALFRGHVTDATSALWGLTSAIDTGQYGEKSSLFVQLASYRSWIDAILAGDMSDSQVANWVSSVPEPATYALMLAGLGAAGFAARRKVGLLGAGSDGATPLPTPPGEG